MTRKTKQKLNYVFETKYQEENTLVLLEIGTTAGPKQCLLRRDTMTQMDLEHRLMQTCTNVDNCDMAYHAILWNPVITPL